MKTQNFRDMINLMESSIEEAGSPFDPRSTRQPGEASVKAYKIPVGEGPYDHPDDKMLWAFASNQQVLTINDISLSPDGQTIMVTPQWDDAYSEDDYESLVSEWGYFATEYDGSEYNDDGEYIGEAIDVDDEMDGGEQLAEDDGPSGVLPDGTKVRIKLGNVDQGMEGVIQGQDEGDPDANTEWSRYWVQFIDGGRYAKKHQFDIVTDEPVVEAPQVPNLTSIAKQLNASLASLGLDFKVTGKNPQGLVMTAPNSDDGWIYDTLGNSFEMHCEDILYKAGLKFGGFTVRGGPETTVLIKFTEGVEAPMEQLGEDQGGEDGVLYQISEDGVQFVWVVGDLEGLKSLVSQGELGINHGDSEHLPQGMGVGTFEECANEMMPARDFGRQEHARFLEMLEGGHALTNEEIQSFVANGDQAMVILSNQGSKCDLAPGLEEATVDRNPNVPSNQKMGGNAPTMNGAEIKQNQSADLGQDIMAKDEDGNEYDASYIERLKQLAGVK